MSKPDPMTQGQRILTYLRNRGPATNMDLVVNLRIGWPHKRIAELEDKQRWRSYVGAAWVPGQVSDKERIVRDTIETAGGVKVTQYRLVRVRRLQVG